MKRNFLRLCSLASSLAVILALVPGALWGQSGNQGTVAITVQDADGAVIPGAKLQLVERRSNSPRSAVSDSKGLYSFVNLNIGTYKLSISHDGYQTKTYEEVIVESSTTTPLRVTLPVGAVTETVDVTTQATAVLQTSSTEIGTVINTTDIENLPISGRSISGLTALTAGYNGTWNGLPEGTQGTNVDGAIANNGRTKYQGTISTMISPRIESFEQVSVVTDGLNLANGFGTATTQLNYVSRRGSNQFHGRAYYDFKNSGLNANSWANDAATPAVRKAKLIQHDFGVSVGGPIFHDKLFFFGTYAEYKAPGTVAATNNIFTAAAEAGNFTYAGTDKQNHTVNVFQLAKANNAANPAAINPNVKTLIDTAITNVNGQGISTLTDPTILAVAFNAPGAQTQYYPVARLDYNLSDKVRMYMSWIMNQSNPVGSYPAPFPGSSYAALQGNNFSRSFNLNYGLDYIISQRLINQFKLGFLYNIQQFSPNVDPNIAFNKPPVYFQMTGGSAAMSGQTYNLPIGYEYPVFSLSDGLTYQRGSHNLNFGFQGYREQDHYYNAPQGFPQTYFGAVSTDPINNAFTYNGTAPTLPAANSTNQAEAAQLYSVLTGRISSVSGSNGYNQSTKQYGPNSFNLDELAYASGVWFQDSWKVFPTLTVNYGIRWDFTVDPHDLKGAYSNALYDSVWGPSGIGNLFQPGTLSGTANPVITQNPRPIHGWYKSPQPSFALNWNPRPTSGFMNKLVGNGATSIRASFGLRDFTEPYQFFWDAATDVGSIYNQNFSLTANTSGSVGTFTPGSLSYGQTLPAFSYAPSTFSSTNSVGAYTFGTGLGVEGIKPNIRQPYSESWSLGIQRALAHATVLEVRYNGNRTVHNWTTYNYNEINIFENGFLTDFKNAYTNYINSGKTSFSDKGGIATPILDAAFANTSSAFTNSTYINYLVNGQAGTFARLLAGAANSTPAFYCALVGVKFAPCAGKFTGASANYPINLFQSNPYTGGGTSTWMTDAGYTNYNALQVDLRQANWHGLQGDLNYTWSHTLGFGTNINDYLATGDNFYTLRNLHDAYSPQSFDIRQVTHGFATYELPFGRGKSFLNNNTLLNEVVGGFTLGTVITFQTGSPFVLTGGYDTFNQNDGGVTLNGITPSTLQSSIGIHHIAGHTTSLAFDPKFFSGGAAGGTANYTYVAPNTTPGTVGNIVWLHGPHAYTQNMSLSKLIPIKDKYALSVQGEFINVWNHPTWGTPSGSLQATTFGTSSISTGARQIELRANITF